MFIQFLLNGLVKGSVFANAALGFALVYSISRIFHLAYAALFVIASYAFYTAIVLFGLSIWPAAFFSIIVTAIISAGIEKGVYQSFEKKNASKNIFLIVSLALLIILINLTAMLFGNEAKVISSEISGSLIYEGLRLTYNQVYQLVICLTVSIGTLIFLKRGNFGLQIRGLEDNPLLMEVLGYNTKLIKTITYGISGGLIAIPACLLSYDIGMDPYVGMPILLNAVVAMIIGGIGSFKGAVIGGFILGLLQSVAIFFFDARWESAVTFLILMVFLLVKPQGLFALNQREV